MKKIKIIDLLNMISKGEEVPKKIKYEDIVFIWNGGIYHHFDEDDCIHESLSDYLDIAKADLNIVVEILEEQEEIDIQSYKELLIDQLTERKYTNADIYMLGTQINALTRAVKQLDRQLHKTEKEK